MPHETAKQQHHELDTKAGRFDSRDAVVLRFDETCPYLFVAAV